MTSHQHDRFDASVLHLKSAGQGGQLVRTLKLESSFREVLMGQTGRSVLAKPNPTRTSGVQSLTGPTGPGWVRNTNMLHDPPVICEHNVKAKQ